MNKKKISDLKNLIAKRRSRFLQTESKPVAKSAPSVVKDEQPKVEVPEVPTEQAETKPVEEVAPEAPVEMPVEEPVEVAETPEDPAESVSAEAETPVVASDDSISPIAEEPVAEEQPTAKKRRRKSKENA